MDRTEQSGCGRVNGKQLFTALFYSGTVFVADSPVVIGQSFFVPVLLWAYRLVLFHLVASAFPASQFLTPIHEVLPGIYWSAVLIMRCTRLPSSHLVGFQGQIHWFSLISDSLVLALMFQGVRPKSPNQLQRDYSSAKKISNIYQSEFLSYQVYIQVTSYVLDLFLGRSISIVYCNNNVTQSCQVSVPQCYTLGIP